MYSQSPLLHSLLKRFTETNLFLNINKLEYCNKTQATVIDKQFKDLSHASTSWKMDQMDLRDKLKQIVSRRKL